MKSDYLLLKQGSRDVTAHIDDYSTQSMLTLPLFFHPFTLIDPLTSLRQSQLENRRSRTRSRPCSNHLLSQRKRNQKRNQLPSMVLHHFRCHILEPNVCVLLHAGTMPGPTSIYHLWKSFEISSNVGGACGEIVEIRTESSQSFGC